MSEQATDQSDILASYAAGPDRLEAAIAGLSAADLDLALSSDTWSIRQIVHHIADGDGLWKEFVKRAIGNPEGEFSLAWYWQVGQDEWARRWAYREREIEPSLALFRASRAHVVQLLAHRPEAWSHSLLIRWLDGEEVQTSVEWVVAMQARHVVGHLDDIRRIREAHGK
jgi:hypothetical protein